MFYAFEKILGRPLKQKTQEGFFRIVLGTTISASGLVSANALTTENATIDVAGTISGAGGFSGASINIGNANAQITQAGAVLGSSFQGASALFGVTQVDSALTGSVIGGIVASNTGTVNNANQKVAFSISSSDISTAANAALIPRMVMQGTNEAGALASYMITITGGLLQTVELTYGTALPI